VISINKKPDGRFPNHIADPHEFAKYHSMDELMKRVKKEKADLGIAYDGDGDRVGFVDEQGKRIQEEHYIMLFAIQALGRSKGKKIILDVRASDKLMDGVKESGGVVKLTRAGHSYIEMRALREHAIFAGETSGHLFFPYCYYPYDDGIFGSLKFAEIVSSVDKISELVKPLPKMNISPEIRIKYDDDKKFRFINDLKKHLRAKKMKFLGIDGVRIRFKNGWALIRASNTAPQITMRFEGHTKKDLADVKRKVRIILKKFKVKI
jgi:phosphomannomutase/phosphoglucomutase